MLVSSRGRLSVQTSRFSGWLLARLGWAPSTRSYSSSWVRGYDCLHVGHSLTRILEAMAKVTGSLQKSTEIMKLSNQVVKLPQVSQAMREMSMEMTKGRLIQYIPYGHSGVTDRPTFHQAGIMEEMMDDVIEADADEELEEEADAEVDKVLFDLTDGKLGQAGKASTELPVRSCLLMLPRNYLIVHSLRHSRTNWKKKRPRELWSSTAHSSVVFSVDCVHLLSCCSSGHAMFACIIYLMITLNGGHVLYVSRAMYSPISDIHCVNSEVEEKGTACITIMTRLGGSRSRESDWPGFLHFSLPPHSIVHPPCLLARSPLLREAP